MSVENTLRTSFLCAVFVTGCTGGDSKPPANAPGAPAPAANQPAAPTAAAADVIPEMQDFMNTMQGEYQPIDAARQKYTAEGADTSDLATVMAREPQIVGTERKDDGRICYTLKLRAGMAVHTYLICWKDGKIVELKRLGMAIE